MSTVFSKIINGEISSYKIYEDDMFIAILDINPIAVGHTLVISKLEIDYIFDLPDNFLNNVMLFSKKIARALEKTIECSRIGISVIGLEVPHCHVHLIPINSIKDMDFSKESIRMSKDEMLVLCNRIRENIE